MIKLPFFLFGFQNTISSSPAYIPCFTLDYIYIYSCLESSYVKADRTLPFTIRTWRTSRHWPWVSCLRSCETKWSYERSVFCDLFPTENIFCRN